MSVSVQESLLDLGGDAPALGSLGSSVRRTPLARGAWVDFCPGWLAGSAEVFARLVESVPWRGEQRGVYDPGGGGPPVLCFFWGGGSPACFFFRARPRGAPTRRCPPPGGAWTPPPGGGPGSRSGRRGCACT